MMLPDDQTWKKDSIEAVIFDMDGVLVDSEPIYFDIERASFAHFGAYPDEAEHHGYVGVTLETMWQRVLDKHQLEFTLEQVLTYHKDNVMTIMRNHSELKPMPHLESWLDWLADKQVPVAVASSSPKVLIELIMDKTGLGRYFNVRVSGEEVANGKPSPDIFLHAANLLGVNPSKCLVIEDSRNGVKAANSAGMRCIGYNNPGSGSQNLSLADLQISGYEQLWALRNMLPFCLESSHQKESGDLVSSPSSL
ncbi:HAD family phosphatase [Paenibacillus zeisoli]|uniref:Beta-phosphoglucomutase n=1 Tax=Paenibacillus zeisoli TaxID=2496267 RepID=A0A3S1BAI8_9BACL|nr:HAD family phosphatase [Paenibacillus zeisoli]RUT35718.1 HAD family phosphatase [Paenibacillus zeisoli]